MAVALVQNQGRGLSFELGGKRTSLLAHQTPLSRRGFSPKSVSGISRPLHSVEMYDKRGRHLGEFNSNTGARTKPADPKRSVEP
ncbi:colicin E3/pyocin S6 family cytotoxin [Pseudomonas aeruginosa]